MGIFIISLILPMEEFLREAIGTECLEEFLAATSLPNPCAVNRPLSILNVAYLRHFIDTNSCISCPFHDARSSPNESIGSLSHLVKNNLFESDLAETKENVPTFLSKIQSMLLRVQQDISFNVSQDEARLIGKSKRRRRHPTPSSENSETASKKSKGNECALDTEKVDKAGHVQIDEIIEVDSCLISDSTYCLNVDNLYPFESWLDLDSDSKDGLLTVEEECGGESVPDKGLNNNRDLNPGREDAENPNDFQTWDSQIPPLISADEFHSVLHPAESLLKSETDSKSVSSVQYQILDCVECLLDKTLNGKKDSDGIHSTVLQTQPTDAVSMESAANKCKNVPIDRQTDTSPVGATETKQLILCNQDPDLKNSYDSSTDISTHNAEETVPQNSPSDLANTGNGTQTVGDSNVPGVSEHSETPHSSDHNETCNSYFSEDSEATDCSNSVRSPVSQNQDSTHNPSPVPSVARELNNSISPRGRYTRHKRQRYLNPKKSSRTLFKSKQLLENISLYFEVNKSLPKPGSRRKQASEREKECQDSSDALPSFWEILDDLRELKEQKKDKKADQVMETSVPDDNPELKQMSVIADQVKLEDLPTNKSPPLKIFDTKRVFWYYSSFPDMLQVLWSSQTAKEDKKVGKRLWKLNCSQFISLLSKTSMTTYKEKFLNEHSIADLHSFLWRLIAIHPSHDVVQRCQATILSLFNRFHCKCFPSIQELFMILINSGISADHCPFEHVFEKSQKYLRQQFLGTKSNRKTVEQDFVLRNLDILMGTLSSAILQSDNSSLSSETLSHLVLITAWLSLDEQISQSKVKWSLITCLNAAVNHISQEDWPGKLDYLTRQLIKLGENYCDRMLNLIELLHPSSRGIQLQKSVSFFALHQFLGQEYRYQSHISLNDVLLFLRIQQLHKIDDLNHLYNLLILADKSIGRIVSSPKNQRTIDDLISYFERLSPTVREEVSGTSDRPTVRNLLAFISSKLQIVTGCQSIKPTLFKSSLRIET